MISHELKLLEIEHNANRISNHEFAHRAFLIISDELAKVDKHRGTNESEQKYQVFQNEKECRNSIIIDKQTKILNDAIEHRIKVEEKSKRIIEECKEQSRYYQDQARYYREKARQIREQTRQIQENKKRNG